MATWYHFSPVENRESIEREDLRPGRKGYIFVTDDPEPMRGAEDVFDEWAIDGPLEGAMPDPTGDARTHDAPGWHAYPGSVPPERLRRAAGAEGEA